MFGTNEARIKKGFREFLNTSIYQFYHDSRLRKAFELIRETGLPIKEIALICGFNGYVNFAKAFKKKYGFPPGTLHRMKPFGEEGAQL